MPDSDLPVKGSHGSSHDRCGVTLDYHNVRFVLGKDFVHARQNSGSQFRKCLVGLHEVQINIRLKIEQSKDLIQHFPVLRCDTDNGFSFGVFPEFKNDWGKFYCFRPCPKNYHDFLGHFRAFSISSTHDSFENLVVA